MIKLPEVEVRVQNVPFQNVFYWIIIKDTLMFMSHQCSSDKDKAKFSIT